MRGGGCLAGAELFLQMSRAGSEEESGQGGFGARQEGRQRRSSTSNASPPRHFPPWVPVAGAAGSKRGGGEEGARGELLAAGLPGPEV